jgi:hypothetical protein
MTFSDFQKRLDIKRRTFLATAGGVLMSSCTERPLADYAYRLKIEVALGGTIFAGESIIRVLWEDGRGEFMNYGSKYRTIVWGEAVAVKLGSRGMYLFALLYGPDSRTQEFFSPIKTPVWAFSKNPIKTWNSAPILTDIQAMPDRAGEVELSGRQLPFLVHFSNSSDPSSVQELPPEALESSFGEGARLHRATLAIVKQPPSDQIATMLPWTSSPMQWLKKPDGEPSSLAEELGTGQFRQWSARSS